MGFLIFLFYMFISSIVLTYGIGLERAFIISSSDNSYSKFLLQAAISVIFSFSILWLINRYIFIPLRAYFFIPLFFMLVCSFANLLTEFIMPFLFHDFKTASKHETLFTYGTVLFVLYEAGSYFEGLIMITAAFAALPAFAFILKAVKKTIDAGEAESNWKLLPLILVSMGFIILAFYSIDTSWILSLVL